MRSSSSHVQGMSCGLRLDIYREYPVARLRIVVNIDYWIRFAKVCPGLSVKAPKIGQKEADTYSESRKAEHCPERSSREEDLPHWCQEAHVSHHYG